MQKKRSTMQKCLSSSNSLSFGITYDTFKFKNININYLCFFDNILLLPTSLT